MTRSSITYKMEIFCGGKQPIQVFPEHPNAENLKN